MTGPTRKQVVASVAASEKLAGCSHFAERAWWRLFVGTDAYGTLDLSDVRRVRLTLFAEVAGFESNGLLERAITELIDRGLLVEWEQSWRRNEGSPWGTRWLHVCGHDVCQQPSYIDRRNRTSRTSPVPPFACCDEVHSGELAQEAMTHGPAPIPTASMRTNGNHVRPLVTIDSKAGLPLQNVESSIGNQSLSREKEKRGTSTSAAGATDGAHAERFEYRPQFPESCPLPDDHPVRLAMPVLTASIGPVSVDDLRQLQETRRAADAARILSGAEAVAVGRAVDAPATAVAVVDGAERHLRQPCPERSRDTIDAAPAPGGGAGAPDRGAA